MKPHVSLTVCLLVLVPLFFANSHSTAAAQGSEANVAVKMPSYVGIAENYDNRKCAVTITLDDFDINRSSWSNCLSMLAKKKLYNTVGIITSTTNWTYVQYWINQGYTEAGSHSASHFDVQRPGLFDQNRKTNYEWQINGSKQDIISHLRLPQWWRNGPNQYVYAWIDPYGLTNDEVQQWLGKCHYLVERGAAAYPSPDPTVWNDATHIFEQTGITAEIGSRYGGTSASTLNNRFDECYKAGKVYHLMAHPAAMRWNKDDFTDQHTSYIANRTDVWYVPLGILGLYRFASTRNVTQAMRIESEPFYTFNITIKKNVHELYGASYPMTYVFKIPPNWTSARACSSYTEHGPWKPLTTRKQGDFFNGAEAARFDFSKHEAYISAAFRPSRDSLYLRIFPSRLQTESQPASRHVPF